MSMLIASVVFYTHILCTHPLIGGVNKEGESDRYSGWVLDTGCKAWIDSDRKLLMIDCINGEKFMLPTQQCSVSKVMKEEKR